MIGSSILDRASMRDVLRIAGLPEPNREGCIPCPLHDEETPSLHLVGEKGRETNWKCFGCEAGGGIFDFLVAVRVATDHAHAAEILEERLGVAPRSVRPALAVAAAERPKTFATIELLANHKCLDPGFLHKLGLADIGPERARALGVRIDGTGVLIPYPDFGGVRIRSRVRQFVETAHPSKWTNEGEALGVYASAKTIESACKRGELIIVEGESDAWTLWAHGIPAAGVPGASMTKLIELQHVEGIPVLYVVLEPGRGGATFVEGVAKRLRELGWPGELFIVDVHKLFGVKDPSALHCDNPERFVERWNAAVEGALPYAPAPEPALEPEAPEWDEVHPWPTLHHAALYGLAGHVVRTLAPETEADAAALLFQFLAGFGNAVGRDAHVRVGAIRQRANLFVAIVGATAKARKGQSFGEIAQVLAQADSEWLEAASLSGLSTGEGLIAKVRDQLDDDGNAVQVEKRAFIVEPELARLLTVSGRKDATISAIVRDAWDGNTLRVLTRKDPLVAKDAHVTFIGHITGLELNVVLSSLFMANGWANRVLWVAVKRSKKLATGGRLPFEQIVDLGQRVRDALAKARAIGEVRRAPDAEPVWKAMYDRFSDDNGLAGAIVARGDAQTLRLALIYALTDGSAEIQVQHLWAAAAAWQYAEESARHIFGERLADPEAQKLLDAARDAYPEGLDGAAQDRATAQCRTKVVRDQLVAQGLIRIERGPSGAKGGRASIVVFAVPRVINQPDKPDLLDDPTAFPVNLVNLANGRRARAVESQLEDVL